MSSGFFSVAGTVVIVKLMRLVGSWGIRSVYSGGSVGCSYLVDLSRLYSMERVFLISRENSKCIYQRMEKLPKDSCCVLFWNFIGMMISAKSSSTLAFLFN